MTKAQDTQKSVEMTRGQKLNRIVLQLLYMTPVLGWFLASDAGQWMAMASDSTIVDPI